LIKNSKASYYKNYFLQNKNKLRKTWDGIKSIIKLSKRCSGSISLLTNDNNGVLQTPQNIANSFNDYFATIGQFLADKIPNSRNNFRSYMPPSAEKNLFLHPIDSNEVFDIINSLNASSVCGPYSIPTNLLKCGSQLLSTPISYIINLSFTEGIFPGSLKLAKVAPIYKSGPPDLCCNYRPISLLSNISKILEKAMYTRLYSYLERFKLIYDLQFGFRKNFSTSHALINLVSSVSDILDRNEYGCGLFLDLQKAFDTVNISILLEKLDIYGVRGTCRKWFESYLQGRQQFVTIDNIDSTINNVECGVPQGSVLGPLLFLLYINDFHRCISTGIAQHFADDTTILYRSRSLRKLKLTMTHEISRIYDWLCANRLSLNESKSEVILFRPRRKRCYTRLTLKIKSKTIFLSNTVRYLGVIFDSFLSWKPHLTELSKKLAKANGLLSKIRHFVDDVTMKSLYHSLFHTHLTYGCLTWGFAGENLLSRIFKLQKKALRIITFSDFKDPTSPLFSQLRIPKLNDVIKINLCLFMHDWLNHNLPRVFDGFFNRTCTHSITRANTLPKLTLPFKRTEKYGSRNIKYNGAAIYNILCNLNIKTSNSKSSFKQEITTLLMSSYV
jgi:Reverse transcriptase (RNA-dependent DNA polymerase)